MTVRYRATPLVEAIFELFCEPTGWTSESLAALEARFRADFGGRRAVLKGVGMLVKLGPGAAFEHDVRHEPERVQLWDQAGTRLIQLAANMCAVNVLPPYRHYVDHLPDVQRLVEAYLREARPAKVTSVGQRYVNRIVLPAGESPERYLQIYPGLPKNMRARHPPFSMQVDAKPLASGGHVILTLTSRGDEGGRPVYILDVYASGGPLEPGWEPIKRWHDEAHAAILECFELSITEESRKLFGQESEASDVRAHV